jgi:hypothetical protein
MKKRITKSLMTFGLCAAALVFAAATDASAQSPVKLTADIPFDFQVGDELLPAGRYEVRRGGRDSNALLVVRRAGGGETAARLTTAVARREAARVTKLVFRRYEGHNYLAEVWTAGDEEHRAFKESGRERSLRRELARAAERTGAKPVEPQIIEIAASN